MYMKRALIILAVIVASSSILLAFAQQDEEGRRRARRLRPSTGAQVVQFEMPFARSDDREIRTETVVSVKNLSGGDCNVEVRWLNFAGQASGTTGPLTLNHGRTELFLSYEFDDDDVQGVEPFLAAIVGRDETSSFTGSAQILTDCGRRIAVDPILVVDIGDDRVGRSYTSLKVTRTRGTRGD